MKRFLFGGSCLGMATLCMLSLFVVLLVGSVLYTQCQTNASFHPGTLFPETTPISTATQLLPSISVTQNSPEIGVTIEIPTQQTVLPETTTNDAGLSGPTASSTDAPFVTATPGNAPLGADIYELTMTAQIVINKTKGADERQKLWATRTAVAGESQIIFATLTAEAQLSATPAGQ